MAPTLHMASVHALLSDCPGAKQVTSVHLIPLPNLLIQLDVGYSQKLTCSKNFSVFLPYFFAESSPHNRHSPWVVPHKVRHSPILRHSQPIVNVAPSEYFPPSKSSRILRELFNVQMPQYAVHLNQARGAEQAGSPTDNQKGE